MQNHRALQSMKQPFNSVHLKTGCRGPDFHTISTIALDL